VRITAIINATPAIAPIVDAIGNAQISPNHLASQAGSKRGRPNRPVTVLKSDLVLTFGTKRLNKRLSSINHFGIAAMRSNPAFEPSYARRRSAAAVRLAAIAPADVPPTFLKTNVLAISQTAAGYTIPLVIPPFITMSQNRGIGAPSHLTKTSI